MGSLDWDAVKIWAVIALLAAVVASAHMAFVVNWAAKRDRTAWDRISMVDARLMSVEGKLSRAERDAEREDEQGN